MAIAPTPFDADTPLGRRRAIIRRNPDNVDEIEMVEAAWGSNPRFNDGLSYRFIRAEGKTFPAARCLIPASEFHMAVGDKRYRVTLDCGNFFYLAGIWEPAMDGWPLSFRIITVYANAEVAALQERHGAIIHRREVMLWLDHGVSECDQLVVPPARMFRIEETSDRAEQPSFALQKA